MAGASCSLTCNVKDRNGNVKVSTLWEELTKFFKGDRRQAVLHYFLTKDSNFLRENSDVLEFDVNGEVTLTSLKKAIDRDSEYSDLSNAKTLEHLNREIQKELKNRNANGNQLYYSEALDAVLKFNKSSQFKDGFMATLSRNEDSTWSVKVVERTPDSEYELADHVQNKILTDAVRLVLEQKGLSVEFLNNPNYAGRYSTIDAAPDANGLYSIASVLDGINTSTETAEVAGHFVVAAMQGNPLLERLVNQLTPEVQKALFADKDAPFRREDFIVSDTSAMEAAGILVGKQLLEPFEEAKKGAWYTPSNLAMSTLKGIKSLLKKIHNFIKMVFGDYKPNKVQKLIDDAKKQASTVAQGFISNPDIANTDVALNAPVTFTGGNFARRMSDEVRRNMKAYHDTLEGLKQATSSLGATLGRTTDPTAKDLYKRLKKFISNVENSQQEALSLEAYAKQGSVTGMVMLLEGITQVLDNDIRSMLDAIQPSDRVNSYKNIVSNSHNMIAVNNLVKNIAEIHLALANKLDTLSVGDKAAFEDVDGNQVTESLGEALSKLEEVLIGREETYEDVKGKKQAVNGLMRVMELKRRQIFIDAFREFYGDEFIEYNAGKVWQQEGGFYRLVSSKDRKVNAKEAIADFVDVLEEDISMFDRFLCSAADCGDFITAVGAKITKMGNVNADRVTAKWYDNIVTLRLQMQDAFGTTDCRMLYEYMDIDDTHRELTGNLVTELNWGAWERDKAEFKKQLKEGFNEYLIDLRQKFYENNKGKQVVWTLTDNQRAVLWHDYVSNIAPVTWKQWHEAHSEPDTSMGGKRMRPNSVLYHNSQWDDLFGIDDTMSQEEKNQRLKRRRWYKALQELKENMDGVLPKGATTPYRAPQFVGRFGHVFRNLQMIRNNSWEAFGGAVRNKMQQLYKVQEDEAWMFGSDNEFNELADDPLENSMYYEREKINRLPLFGINKLHDMSKLSTDLFGTLLAYGSMAATYNAMESVVSVFELGRDVLKQRRVNTKGGKSEGRVDDGYSRAYTRYLKFLEKQVYGINVTPPSWDRKGVWRKIANTMSSIGGRILLYGNVPGGIVNTGTGMFEIFKEAVAGENFTLGEIMEAHAMYTNEIMKTMGLSLIDAQRTDDFNELWIRHWNIRSENQEFYRGQKFDTKAMSLLDNRLGEWFDHTMMLPYSSGDHYMQTVPYYAMGIHTKVYDENGNKIRLRDAYKIVDGEEVFAYEIQGDKVVEDPNHVLGKTSKKIVLKDKIFRTPGDIVKYNTIQNILKRIANYEEYHPSGRDTDSLVPEFFSNDEQEYLKDEGFPVPTNVGAMRNLKSALDLKARDLVFNVDDEAVFMSKCRNICNRLHGIYNTEDKVCFQQNFYGSLVTSMRGYALGMVNRRYSRSKFNVAQKKVVEGTTNTALKVFASILFDIYNADNWKAVSEAALLTVPGVNAFTLFSSKFGDTLKADMKKAGFSEHQYYNMRRFGADFLIIEALCLMKLLSSPGSHFGLNDDEDSWDDEADTSDNVLAGLVYYFMMRWDREQEAFNTPSGMWNEATSLLDYTPVGISGSIAIYNIVSLAIKTQLDKATGDPSYDDSDLYYQSSSKGKYEQGDEKWKVKFKRLCPYIRSFYTFQHPYDAASGFEYGRRIRGK